MTELDMRVASVGDAEHDRIFAMIDAMRAGISPLLSDTDPQDLAMAMAAASTFAGTLLGALIAVGICTDQDKRRMTDTMARNFREGIDIGKRRAERIAAMMETGGTA